MRAPATGPEPSRSALRRPVLLLGGACMLFIVYGSLFPFEFLAAPQPLTAETFDLRVWRNRSDALDNTVLFIPLGVALCLAFRTTLSRLAASFASWAVLGAGLQVLQLYVPGRIGSVADAINNALGMVLGLVLGYALAPWLRDRQRHGRAGEPLGIFLVVAWYAYESFPFLPTLDRGLLAAHAKPFFAPLEFDGLRLLRHALAAALGLLGLLAAQPLWSRRAALVAAALVVIGSEILVPYGALRRETLLGIVIGMALGARLDRVPGPRKHALAFALALTAYTMTVVTDFRGPPSASRFTFTPFSQLLWQGATTDIPTLAFEALAIAAMLWAGLGLSRPKTRSWQSPAIVIALVAGFELLRMVLRSGPADSSTFVLALLLAPFAAAAHRRVRNRATNSPTALACSPVEGRVGGPVASAVTPPVTTPSGPVGAAALPRRSLGQALFWPACALIGVAAALRLLLEVPSLPYNVVKLLDHGSPLRLAFFSAALLALGAAPWWVARIAARGGWQAALRLPVLLLLAACVSLLLLTLAVPADSLDKITGSLDLYRRVTTENTWGPVWQSRMLAMSATEVHALERIVRTSALLGLLLVPMTMAVIVFDRAWPLPAALAGGATLAMCWWLASWIVVEGAITDNLTELIAVGGVPWLAMLALLFAFHVAWLGMKLPTSTVAAVAFGVFTVVSLPLGESLLKQGLEPVIVKYGAVWSAPQFLLGPDRVTTLTDHALFLRWSVLYLGMLCICAMGMALARRGWPGERHSHRRASGVRHGVLRHAS